MRSLRSKAGSIIWILIVLFMMNGGMVESLFNSTGAKVQPDTSMNTENYQTMVDISEDGSYKVNEKIAVSFLEPRHGIYRYIQDRGTIISYDGEGNKEKEPYCADVELLSSNTPADVSSKNGNKVFQFGDANQTVLNGQYHFAYRFTPKFQKGIYNQVYYNVFPTQWQNQIPKGSTFSVTFPKKFDMDQLQFYYGKYGESKKAIDVLDIQKNTETNSVQGTLKQDLSFGEGITCFANMGEGYFTAGHNVNEIPWLILIPSMIIFAIVIILFLLCGRDAPIIPSIQYQPPEGLDSAAVGYIIDGKVQDKDLLSLIIYWADKGHLCIEEEKKDSLILKKIKELSPDAPPYQNTIFRKLFKTGEQVNIEELQYQFTDTLEAAKSELKQYFSDKKSVYTTASKVARVVSLVLTTLPFWIFVVVIGSYSYTSTARAIIHLIMWIGLGAGTVLFAAIVDRWYGVTKTSRKKWTAGAVGLCFLSMAGYVGSYIVRVMQKEVFNYSWIMIIVIFITIVMISLTGFMKKRTTVCIEWMGRLAGLRDFIETAELDRMQAMAQEHPEMFYHIMPYAYVFGLSEIFAKRLEGLSIPAPEWYHTNQQFTFFDYYLFSNCMMSNMEQVTQTLTIPEPPSTNGDGGGGFDSGGFSGGGFSGGGFGGGGGGSW
ncbi:MAG: DUF2207 domain-containing protein [Lachnospiraceae bacterium]